MAKEVEALTVLLAARTADFEKLMNSAERRIDKVERRMRGSTAIIERDAQRMAQKVGKSFDDVGKSFNLSGVALGGIGLAALTKEALTYSDAWTRAKNSLAVAGLEGSRQTAVLDALFDSAQKNSVAVGSLTDLYGKASQNARELGADQNSLIKFTDGVAVALKASGTSTTEASGALLQLSQLLGSGTVRAEEFNSVNEGAPTILKAVASGLDGAGGSISKLRSLVLAGAVSSKQFFDAFLKGKPVIDDMAARALPTVENAVTRINNALTKYVGENSGAQGATRSLISGLNYLADNFDQTADIALQFAGIIAAALTGRAIGGMIASLGLGAIELGKFARALSTLRAAGGIAGLASAFGGLGAALGPIGALLAVVGAAGLYFYNQTAQAAEGANRAAEAIKAIGPAATSSAEEIRKLADEMAKLPGAQLQAGINDTSDLISQQAKTLRDSNPFRSSVGNFRRAPGAQGGAGPELEFNKATAKFLNDNDLKAYTKALAALSKRYPEQAEKLAEAQRAADLYSQAIARRAAQDQAQAQQASGDQPPKRAVTSFHTGAGDSVNAAIIGSDALSEVNKSDHDKAVDKQTDDLIKAYTATGQKLTDGVKEALREFAGKIVNAEEAKKETDKTFDASAAGNALDLIKGFEGFRSSAYFDVNHYRAGFGSDTTTDTNGKVSTVTKETVVSVDDALRDLKRRVLEFQDTVKGQIGGDKFDSLGKEQQAALTSIAYNYGKLPKDIVNAILSGTTDDVAKAIRGHAGDNGGVNRERRNKEADIFEGGATAQAKTADTAAEFDKNSARDSKRSVEDLDAETAALNRKAEAIARGAIETNYFDAQAEKDKIVREELRKLQDAEIEATPKRQADIEAEADAVVAASKRKFDAEKGYQDLKRSAEGLKDAEDFFAEGATSAFTDVISGAKSAKAAVHDLVKSLADAAIQALLLGKGPLAGLFGTAAAGGGTGGIFGAIFAGLGGGKASGGRVSKGQVYPVGENGREYFSPGENGRIIPAIPQMQIPTARPARSTISPNLNMKISLDGANGDETIRRISAQAASQAGRQAYAQAVASSDGRWQDNQNFISVHGHTR